MGLFNKFNQEDIPQQQESFGSQNTDPAPEPIAKTYPYIKEEDFIDTSNPNEKPSSEPIPSHEQTTDSIECALGMPIDGVYLYMEKNWASTGMKDATDYPDVKYMEAQVEIIRQGLQRRLELTRLKYSSMIRDYATQVDKLNQFGLSSTMSQLQAQIETCKEHLAKLTDLEDKFKKEDPALTSMVESYKRGFTLGVAKVTQDLLKTNGFQS